MNEQERRELEILKRRQAELGQELSRLSAQLTVLEQRLQPSAPDQAPGASHPPQPSSTALPRAEEVKQVTPPPLPPTIPIPSSIPAASAIPIARAVPPRPVAAEPGLAQPSPFKVAPPGLQSEGATTQSTVSDSGREAQGKIPGQLASAPADKSLELRLGTYWLSRVGIVMVVTGLVFFGHLAYQNYVKHLGPGGKVVLLYLATGVLLAAGAWWQRRAATENLKNYGQVLFAGGLAALYFTTYAAHHVSQLLVIRSALWDGLLLLGCAGFIVAVAEYKRSEVLAVLALGLAYYTSVITRVGYFTLYSNLVLTIAAVIFLVRNRWAVLSFASLLASYLSYGFWRFLGPDGWHWAPEQGIWAGTYFLLSYWAVFTAGVFLTRDKRFAGQNRAGFLTLNNGAFFSFFLLTMMQVHQGGFWKFALIYGGGLLCLAGAAQRYLPEEPLGRDSYLSQGLLLVTVGLISKFAGLQLALVLAMESVVLLISGQQRKNLVLLTGAFISAGLATAWAIDGLKQMEPSGVYLAVGLGGLMVVNTVIVSSRKPRPETLTLRAAPAYFAALALLVWSVATWDNAARPDFPVWVAFEAVPVILSIYVLEIPELSLLAGAYLALGQLVWTYNAMVGELKLPWWSSVAMTLLSIGLCEWWRRQKVLNLTVRTATGSQELRVLPALFKNIVFLGAVAEGVRAAGGWSAQSLTEPGAMYLAVLLGAVMLGDALLADRRTNTSETRPLRAQPASSTALALMTWLAVSWHHTPREQFPLVLGVETVLLTCSFYLLRVPEIPLLGQAYLVLAQLSWLWQAAVDKQPGPWWSASLLLAMTLGLSHWWQRQKLLPITGQLRYLWQCLYALALVAILFFRLKPEGPVPGWLALTSTLAVVLTIYGVVTRAWFIALCGQLFVLISGVEFFRQLAEAKPGWSYALAPLAALILLSVGTARWFARQTGTREVIREPLLGVALFYRWTGLAMALVWVSEYIPQRERVWVLSVLGLGVFGLAGWWRNREILLFSAVFSVNALVLFWASGLNGAAVNWTELVLVAALLVEQRVAHSLPERFPLERNLHTVVIVAGGLSLWLFVSHWLQRVEQSTGASYMTVSWSVLGLALFTAGFALRERVYRWLGLAVLACALGRVVVFDVWKLETLYRILSFMALGIVLLVLGFVYNKYQEKIREWL